MNTTMKYVQGLLVTLAVIIIITQGIRIDYLNTVIDNQPLHTIYTTPVKVSNKPVEALVVKPIVYTRDNTSYLHCIELLNDMFVFELEGNRQFLNELKKEPESLRRDKMILEIEYAIERINETIAENNLTLSDYDSNVAEINKQGE